MSIFDAAKLAAAAYVLVTGVLGLSLFVTIVVSWCQEVRLRDQQEQG